MSDQKRNASRRLPLRLELPSWELILLIVLAVTVLGVALRSPMKSFPDLAMSRSLRQLDRDPYDLQNDHGLASDARVETGL